jgi:hypothetical protein
VDGDCSYYMNAALDPKDSYEDYFVHDVAGGPVIVLDTSLLSR